MVAEFIAAAGIITVAALGLSAINGAIKEVGDWSYERHKEKEAKKIERWHKELTEEKVTAYFTNGTVPKGMDPEWVKEVTRMRIRPDESFEDYMHRLKTDEMHRRGISEEEYDQEAQWMRETAAYLSSMPELQRGDYSSIIPIE